MLANEEKGKGRTKMMIARAPATRRNRFDDSEQETGPASRSMVRSYR